MLSAHDIVSTFGLRNATPSGPDQMLASCPFTENHKHGDSNPSWRINLNTGLWHCFGCSESGNLIQLAERVLGMSSMEAHNLVYGDLDMEDVENLINGPKGSTQTAARPLTDLERDVQRWASLETPYWGGRGFTKATVQRWGLGYDPSCNRATVPVRYRGETVGWSKRRLDEHDGPKWRHSPGFKKSEFLFGFDECQHDACIVVEAPLSVVMLWQQGIPDAVATFGCGMSQHQADIIRGRFKSCAIFYDPDKAGWDGRKQAVELLSPYMDVYVVGQTRDDPAAMTVEENRAALSSLIPWYMAGF